MIGYCLTAVGIGGILASFAGEQSEYVDPITFAIATISIFVAIVGLALVFKLPDRNKAQTASSKSDVLRSVPTDYA